MAQLVGQSHREPGGVGTALNFFFSQGLPGPTGPVGLPGPPGSSGLVVSESLLAPAGTLCPCPLSPVFSCVPPDMKLLSLRVLRGHQVCLAKW